MVEEIEGQLSLMEYLASLPEIGMTCYKVTLAEVTEYVIEDISVYAGRTVYYLKSAESDENYEIIHSRDFDRSIFLDYEEAVSKAEESLADMIDADDLEITHFQSYSYTRKEDERKMTAFYAVLDNGLVLAKDPSTPQYITNCTEEEAKQHCKKVLKGKKVTEEPTLPPLNNMYRCKEGTGCLYTEVNCNLVARDAEERL